MAKLMNCVCVAALRAAPPPLQSFGLSWAVGAFGETADGFIGADSLVKAS
jgi:hypothetical protein